MNILSKFDLGKKKDREFIVEERDVTTVLSAINKHRKTFDVEIGNCGWADEPTKWFIAFAVTDKRYGAIISELDEYGKFRLTTSPNCRVRLYFEK